MSKSIKEAIEKGLKPFDGNARIVSFSQTKTIPTKIDVVIDWEYTMIDEEIASNDNLWTTIFEFEQDGSSITRNLIHEKLDDLYENYSVLSDIENEFWSSFDHQPLNVLNLSDALLDAISYKLNISLNVLADQYYAFWQKHKESLREKLGY